MLNEMNKKELKEMIRYFVVMADSHRAAGRIEIAYEYGSKRADCECELMRRAAK